MNNLILALVSVLALTACDKISAPADPLHAAAQRTCKDTIEARAIDRKTIDYLSDDPVAKTANGQLDVSIKFSAKNEIGRASTMLARCVVSADGKALADITVKTIR
jgi:hypothetical protein